MICNGGKRRRAAEQRKKDGAGGEELGRDVLDRGLGVVLLLDGGGPVEGAYEKVVGIIPSAPASPKSPRLPLRTARSRLYDIKEESLSFAIFFEQPEGA